MKTYLLFGRNDLIGMRMFAIKAASKKQAFASACDKMNHLAIFFYKTGIMISGCDMSVIKSDVIKIN